MTEQDVWKQNSLELDFFPEKTSVLLGYIFTSTVFHLKIISHTLDFESCSTKNNKNS